MFRGQITVGGRTAVWAFTTRADGVSAAPFAGCNLAAHVGDDPQAVRSNRAQLESSLDVGPLSWMGPVHGTDIAVIEAPTSIVPNVDALATSAAGVPLATLGADCVPLLLVCDDVVLAAHVGWRGFVAGMTQRIAALLTGRGLDASTAQVLLGPAICGACYGIPDERALAIEAVCPDALRIARTGGPGADIRAGLTAQFTSMGAAVTAVGPCTYESTDLFSHRRDGLTGRQAGVVAWLP